MTEITITREIHEEAPSPDERAEVAGVGYVSRDRNVLMQSIRIGKRSVIRRSEDNARSWEIVEEWQKHTQLEGDLVLDKNLPNTFFCDPDNGVTLRPVAICHDNPRILAWDYARSPFWRTMRQYIQYSRDEGLTWSEPEQIIAQGDEYDETHWMRDVWYGKNGAAFVGARIIKAPDGAIISALDGSRLFENGDIIDPNADPATAAPDGAIEWQAGCFFGRWRDDASGIDWTTGERFALPKKYSCDGSEEPSIDFLPDGRLFMGLRARTYPHTGQELPSLHYYAVSEDDGKTWGEPAPLLYDDGSYAYSPACLINVFRSNKNNRFYVITNFADGPCVNCDPRNRLYIVELDTDTFRLKKDTLTIIMRNDKAAGQSDRVRFSNYRWFEDRETKDLVLYVTPCGDQGQSVQSHSYRCDIQLPER